MKFTPFPTFTNKQGITGIQPIQLPQARPSFPTARGPVRRTPEPKLEEKIGGILPLIPRLLQQVVQQRRQPEQTLSAPEFYKSINADPTAPSLEDQAQYAAYTAYGPQRDVGGFRGMDIVDLVAASQLGRGAKDYVSSALKLRQAEDIRDTNINTQRGQLIKEYLKPQKVTYSPVTLIDKRLAEKERNPYFQGRRESPSGRLEILTPEGYVTADENYILKTGTGNVTIPKNPNVEFIDDTFGAFYEKEASLNGLISIATPLIKQYEGLSEDDIVPGTFVADIVNFADRVNREVGELGKVMGVPTGESLFGTSEKTGGSYGRVGDGQISANLYKVLNDENATDEAKEQALAQFESMLVVETKKDLKELFGETIYNDVRARSRFLQLAYVAAAVNGQTGRTLSDKDLAYHIQIVGLGQTTNPEVLVENLKSFVADSINQVDNSIKLGIQQQFPKMKLEIDDPYVQSFLSDFYLPNDDTYSLALSDYTFRPFNVRRPGIGANTYMIEGSTFTPSGGSSDIFDLNSSLDNILGVEEK